MFGKIVLWLSAAIFTSYGLVCLFTPNTPAVYAGLLMTNADAYAEMGAMYGGLQTGFGLFLAFSAANRDYFRPGLSLLMVVVGCLALARLYSAFTFPGPGTFTTYTYGALFYETLTAVLAAWALRTAKNP